VFVPEDQATGVPDQERELALRRGWAEDERWHQRSDGSRFFASGTLTPLRDGEGAWQGFTKICRDITERKLAEQEMRRVVEQQRLALEAAQLGWWRLDVASGLIHWDERARSIYGGETDTIRLEDALDRMPPEDRAELGQRLQELIERPTAERQEAHYRVRHFAGGLRHVESLAQPLVEGEGEARRLVGLVGTAADITERRRAQQALQSQENALQQMADMLPQIVWGARPDGTVDYYNRRWYEYTGQPAGTTGVGSWEAVTPDAARIDQVWAESVRTGAPFELEYRLRRAADGMERWHLGRAVPIRSADGTIERWIGTNTDIHDRKLLESSNASLLEAERQALQTALEARRAAEEASRMKDEFLATVSHELRTPLNAIVGWSTLLQDPQIDAATQAEGIEAIQRNAEAQARLIEDILDIARITTGKMRMQPQNVDLGQVIGAAVETVRAGAKAKGIDLQVDLAPDLPPVLADPDRMQQVFWNLLSNAIKFTPAGGRVRVLAETARNKIVVTVEDTGIGIEAPFLSRVFDRFLQADARPNRRQGGLGLGLAIVRHLVELHGGTVAAHSPGPGGGSTFTVELPAGRAATGAATGRPARPARAASRRGELEGKRVLVLDDDPDTRRVIEAVLGRAGAEVTLVGTVADAIGVLTADHRFDAVLSDIGMPGEDGYVFARRMRTMEQGRALPKLPLAAVTAYTREQDRTRALAAGFDAFVSKPIRPTELVEIVSVMVHSRRSPPATPPAR
jgi:PAS domain S-box-containing protein